MSAANSEPNAWLIKRNCSAGPRHLALMFGSLAAVSFAFGLGFAAFGLWMVLPFVGIELVAVAAAFLCYGRHAADFERIVVTQHGVSVEQVEGTHRKQWELDPHFSHVQVESQGRQWGKRVRIYLLAPGIKLELGRHLLDERRSRLGQELRGTLMRARAGAL